MRYFEVASRLIVQEPNKDIAGHGLGLRHIQILLQFFLATIFVAMNMTLPITIVAMTTTKYEADIGYTAFPNWTDQSLILVSLQCGYAVTQLFGSCVSNTYGFQFVMAFSMFLCALFNLLLPILVSNYGSEGLILCMLVQGASQGFSLPVIPDFLDKWVPRSERNSIGTFMYAANALGAALGTKFAAYLSTSIWGWTFAYYILAALGFAWTYFMLIYGRNEPENCEDISAAERDFIKYDRTIRDKVPWRKILSSPTVLAIWAAHAGTFWALWLMTAEIPTYLSRVLKFNIYEDGNTVSDAYFMSWLFSFVMSGSTDYMIRSRILSVHMTRKIAQSIASYLAAACLIILGFLTNPHSVIFCLITIYVALTASFWGFMLNYNDVSQNRGIISEIGGFIATLTTLFPALFKQFIVTDQSDRTQWAIMFWLTAGISILSNTAFFFYSTENFQDFDPPRTNQVEQSGLKFWRRTEDSKPLIEKSYSIARNYNNDYNSKGENKGNEEVVNGREPSTSTSKVQEKQENEEKSESD